MTTTPGGLPPSRRAAPDHDPAAGFSQSVRFPGSANGAEKPSECRTCGNVVVQPATGRPRVYCSVGCRRAAEYELRRVQALLTAAEKGAQKARADAVGAWDPERSRKLARFWAKEITSLQERLQVLLQADQEGFST